MSGNDRGWNIVWKKARKGWVAKLMGASRSEESSLYADIALGFVMMAVILKLLGAW
ncbi:hypothetical protein [Natronosalvus caseinilyticus]|uniref:hypothetical protein n=1 Tax=Natronosalvus caseinilyticus TaxID=2953747 RepID=UPI0028A89A15|nr:hypothetical protein [Natronosalvus caseinilyticus]